MDLEPSILINHEELQEPCSNMDHGPQSIGSQMNAPPTGSGHQKIDMWRNRNFDSGFQTMNPSEAPSIISSLHPSSHISGISSVADYDQVPSLSDQQKQKFDGIAYNTQNDTQYSAVKAIPELTNLMKDNDPAVVYKAVYIMQNIAKMDSDVMRRQKESRISDVRVIVALRDVLRDRVEHPNIIRVALGTLFNICNRQEGIELVAKAISFQPDIIQCLVCHTGTFQFSCYKYAVLTLHSILSDKHRGAEGLNISRQCDALTKVTAWLDAEKSEKLLPVIVDLVRILCDRNNEQKTAFLKLNGPQKLLRIIQVCQYENLLWRSTQLLKTLSNFDANNLVSLGAREILARLLCHESQRLVLSALETLRNISDVPSQFKEDLLLKSLIQLLGSRHSTVMLYTIQILSNVVANNKYNKEFLICNHSVDMLLRSLMEATAFMPGLNSKEAHVMEEYMESILCTIRQLCVGNSFSEKVQLHIFKDPLVFLDKLLLMRPVLLKQTMNLLLKVAHQNPLLQTFRDAQLNNTGFIEQIVHILKVSCNQLNTQEQIEGVKVKDLVHQCIELLRILSRQGDLLDQIVFFLRTPENMRIADAPTLLPIFVLQKTNIDENTKKSVFSLIHNMMFNEQMAATLESNQVLIDMLQHLQLQAHSAPDLCNIANNIMRMMFDKKGKDMYQRYPVHVEPPPQNKVAAAPMTPMEGSPEKPMMVPPTANDSYEGAHEHWPLPTDEQLAGMYPVNNVAREPSRQYNSPVYNSPTGMYPEYPQPPDYYCSPQQMPPMPPPPHHLQQPSTSYARTTRPTPPHYEYDSPQAYNMPNHHMHENLMYPHRGPNRF